jgi:hypothetical protein
MEGTSPLRESWVRRWASLLILAVIVMVVMAFHPGPGIHSDGIGYHLWTYALLRGDLGFTWVPDLCGVKRWGLIQPDVAQQRYHCKFPPGVALLRLPLMAFVVDPARNAPPYSAGEDWACIAISAAVLLAICGLCLRVCERLGVSTARRHAAVLLTTFGTGLYHYATYDGAMSHIYSALGAAILLWIAVVAVQDRVGRLPLVLTPVVLMLLLLVRNTNVLLITFWSLGLFVWGWNLGQRSAARWFGNAAIIAAGVGSAAAIQLALNYVGLGRFQLNSYADESFDFSRLMLPDVMFSYERGLFTYNPIVLVALLGGLIARPTRWLTAGVALVVLTYGTLYGFWHCWPLGHGFGHRGFVDMAPWLVPVLALSLDRLGDRVRRLVFCSSLVAVMMTVMVMSEYWNGTYPHCWATQHDYYNAITYRVYRSVYKRVWGVRPPKGRWWLELSGDVASATPPERVVEFRHESRIRP